MRALRQGPQAELWQALIQEGAVRSGVRLDEHEESYLGFVLIRHLRDEQLGARTVATDWLQALDEIGQVRADALRDVGDRCLLIAGLFPRLAERRQVSPDYFVALGRGAYAGVADCTRSSYADLFAQLARVFRPLVQVLAAMRAAPKLASLELQLPGGSEAWLPRSGLTGTAPTQASSSPRKRGPSDLRRIRNSTRHWVPAFAGMTKSRGLALIQAILR